MIIYLAGGINGLSDADAKNWREIAKAMFAEHGIECLDPMRRDYRGIEGDHIDEIVHGDLDDIKASDIVLAMCSRASWGTAMEIRFCFEAGVRVVGICADASPSPWLVYHVESIWPTLEAAVDAVLALVL